MKTTLDINNEVISWAITRAGFKMDEFFTRFPRAQEWLEDKKKPTLPQLRDFAKKVHLPFGYLFLNQPFTEPPPIPFFRTADGETNQISLNVRDTVLTLQKRQDWLRDYFIEQGIAPLEFVGKFTIEMQIENVIEDIRETLGLTEQWANQFPNWQIALNHLAEKVEEAGIFIVFNSIVGNNTHRPISVEECRGFVCSDVYAPFMFINSADSKSAQMFTIVHELAHLWIGESAGFDFRQLQPADHEIEKFCDRVAADFLVPEGNFHEAWNRDRDYESLARQFKVSQIVIARKALDLGKIDREEFFDFYNQHMQQHFQKKESQESGGDFYATARRRLNLRFVANIHKAVQENKLLYKDAYELTGLRGPTYRKAINEFGL